MNTQAIYLGIGAGGFWIFMRSKFGAFQEIFDGNFAEAIAECAKRNEPLVATRDAQEYANLPKKTFESAPERTDIHRLEDARRELTAGNCEKAVGIAMSMKRFDRMADDVAEFAARQFLAGVA